MRQRFPIADPYRQLLGMLARYIGKSALEGSVAFAMHDELDLLAAIMGKAWSITSAIF